MLPTHVLHAGSNAAFLDPGAKAVHWVLTQLSGRVAISFDPNVRPATMGNLDGVVERYAALARRATIFKLSEEVAAWL